jgi:hypothetical protein
MSSVVKPFLCGLLALCLGGMAVACASAGNRQRELGDAVRGYADSLRWGRVEEAALHLPPERRAEFVARKRAALAGLSLHEVEVRHIECDADGKQARAIVALSFTAPSVPVMHEEVIEQRWELRRNLWTLVAQSPVKPTPGEPVGPADLY